jgi:hypothetical protein
MNRRPHLPHRRQVLRAAGVSLALPFLPSAVRRGFAAEQPVAAAKRLVVLSLGYGVTSESWFPDRSSVGPDYVLPAGLAPLQRHRQRFSIIQGLSHKHSNEAHWGSTFYLTGANRYAGGGMFSNTVSMDQVAAETLGKETRFSSLQFTSRDVVESGHGPGLSLAWDRQGKPLAGLDTPVAAYARLFGDEGASQQERAEMLADQRSILDVVLSDAKSFERRLSAHDRRKLDEYFQSIRGIEVRLAKEKEWLGRPKPKPGLAEPGETLAGEQEMRLMYDIIVAALRTDSTRVITYRQPLDSLLRSMEIDMKAHDMSHYDPGPKLDASRRRDLKQSDMLAALLDALERTPDADGTTLLDNTVVVMGSNIRSSHHLDNCPTLVAGGGAGILQGRHTVLAAKQTPLCNLWLTLLQGLGADVTSFGDSTATIPEIIA